MKGEGMIRFLIHTTVSKRDMYGNCYSYSSVTSTKTGRSLVISSGAMSDGGNVKALLRKAGLEHSEIHYTESMLPIREWNRREPSKDHTVYEHEVNDNMILNLEEATA